MHVFGKESKVICLVAVHQRYEVSIETIKRLNNQTHPIEVVVVGGREEERLIAGSVKCRFIRHSNRWLGRKWQSALDYARERSPDAVMICGSDSWLTLNWVERMLPNLNKCDVAGKNIFYTCNAVFNEPLEIIKRTYKDSRNKNMPAGSGRLISASILNKINWQMFPNKKNKGLDTLCRKKIIDAGGVYAVFNDDDDVNLLGIKSHWDVITSYDRLKNAKSLRDMSFTEDAEAWIERNYPGGVEIIEGLRDVSYKRATMREEFLKKRRKNMEDKKRQRAIKLKRDMAKRLRAKNKVRNRR